MVEDLLAQTEKMFTRVETETFTVEIKVAIGTSGIMELEFAERPQNFGARQYVE